MTKMTKIFNILMVVIFLFILAFGGIKSKQATSNVFSFEYNPRYEFYCVNNDTNNIVAFMPDNIIFTFEKGTYDWTDGQLTLNGPNGEEIYTASGATEDGYVTLTTTNNKSEDLLLKTTGSIGGFLNGFLFDQSPFENYAGFQLDNHDMEITFDTDGTFIRQTKYVHLYDNKYLNVVDDRSTFAISSKDTLTRMDRFDENGIEEGTFESQFIDTTYKYKRILIYHNTGGIGSTIYTVVYTNNLSITGEDLYNDMISAVFVPLEEKEYERITSWSDLN